MPGSVRRALEDLAQAQAIDVKFPDRTIRFGIKAGKLPQSEVAVYFVDCPELYNRDGIYTEDKDEALRFAMLSRAVLETCQRCYERLLANRLLPPATTQ